MSIFMMVQEDFPQIKSLSLASKPLEVPVKARHRKGAKASHTDCTMSRAVQELLGAEKVYTTLSAVVAVKNGKATQYSHGSGSRDMVTINDTRGEVVDQTVWLNAPNQKNQICSILRGKVEGIPKKVLEDTFSQTAMRINELRNEGHNISSERGCDGRVIYKYVAAPDKSKPGKRYLPRTVRKYRKVEKADLLREHA